MGITQIDHCAITVADMERTIAFYRDVLGCEILWERAWREGRIPIVSLRIGSNVINVHPATVPLRPHAHHPTPGSADLCFRWEGPLEQAIEQLARHQVAIEEGPVPRPACDGRPGRSIYFRDPDQNLLELLSTHAG